MTWFLYDPQAKILGLNLKRFKTDQREAPNTFAGSHMVLVLRKVAFYLNIRRINYKMTAQSRRNKYVEMKILFLNDFEIPMSTQGCTCFYNNYNNNGERNWFLAPIKDIADSTTLFIKIY